MNLRLDWCSYKAAKHAVMNWHYSKTMPVGKIVKIGVWENDKFIGAVLFSRGGSPYLGNKYNLLQTQICELTRVALNKHSSTVTKIISISIKMLKKLNPGLRMIISYADQNQNHIGAIYQAGNWIYVGEASNKGALWNINGKIIHNRTVSSKYKKKSTEWIKKYVDPNAHRTLSKLKHKYIMPLDKIIYKYIKPLSKSYPKKNCDSGVNRSTPSIQDGGSGAEPTESLYNYARS